MRENLLAPAATLLPTDPASQLLTAGKPAAAVVMQHPESALAWATLAQQSRLAGKPALEIYAYARVGYHRGLDTLRKNGWRGHGSVPYSHAPNRGVLTALYELQLAATAIDETSEAARLTQFINDSDPQALTHLTANQQPPVTEEGD